MSDKNPDNVKTLWDIKIKKKNRGGSPQAGSSMAAASKKPQSAAGRRAQQAQVKSESEGDSSGLFEDDPEWDGPGLRDEVTARLLKRREKRKPATPGSVVSKEVSATVRFTSNRVISRGDLVNLSNHVEPISRVLNRSNPSEEEWAIVRSCIHALPFVSVDQKGVHSRGAFKELRRIEDMVTAVPEDIRLDAMAILKKWRNADYDPELLRGIDLTQTIKRGAAGGTKNTKRTRHYKLEGEYPWKRDPQVEGHNDLFVGEWWPLQICALRDGAHGEMEAGISGNINSGAISVIISGGALYPDLDELDRVLYCGTMGVEAPTDYSGDPAATEKRQPGDRVPSPNTNLLLTSYRKGTQIRLFRSSKSKSPYAPADGLRYDGLYTIRAYEILDRKIAVYRFELIREPNQPAIRCDPDHPGVKPNKTELSKWQGVKRTLKGER